MSIFKNPFRSANADGDLNTYKAIRADSKTWFDKIMRHPANDGYSMTKAARNAGIAVEGNTIIFEDEGESAVLMDNLLFDYRPEKKSLAESAVFAAGELTPLEDEWHQSALESRTSLYDVAEVNSSSSLILLKDLLFPDVPDVWITDLNLAKGFKASEIPIVMFTRVVSLQGIHLTGGFSFFFDAAHKPELLNSYHKAFETATPAQATRLRTRHFLRQNRQIGLAQAPADLPPSS